MATAMEPSELPPGAVLCISAQIHIEAPASHVFDCIIRVGDWDKWNTFVPSVEAVEHPKSSANNNDDDDLIRNGSKMTLQVRMDPEHPTSLRPQRVAVTSFSKPPTNGNQDAAPDGRNVYSVSWGVEGFAAYVLRTNRTSQCVAEGGGDRCRFATWEVMNGPTAYIIRRMYGSTLQSRFEDTARDLKEYAERTWQQRG